MSDAATLPRQVDVQRRMLTLLTVMRQDAAIRGCAAYSAEADALIGDLRRAPFDAHATESGTPVERTFPIQGPTSHRRIPWWLAEEAFAVYSSRYGMSQSLERLAERGGFGAEEMDLFVPGWRDRIDRVKRLEASVAALTERARRVETAREPRRFDQVPNGCWVACIAGLTDISHADLAALVPKHVDYTAKQHDYHNAVNAVMRASGWRLAYIGPDVPRGYSIGSGTSPRGHRHAVIMRDGVLWHDPHPSRAGIAVVEEYEVVIPLCDSPAMRVALASPGAP
jgi:hypothetical protein